MGKSKCASCEGPSGWGVLLGCRVAYPETLWYYLQSPVLIIHGFIAARLFTRTPGPGGEGAGAGLASEGNGHKTRRIFQL